MQKKHNSVPENTEILTHICLKLFNLRWFCVCFDCGSLALSISYTSGATSHGCTTLSPGESPDPGSGGKMECLWGRAAMAFGSWGPLPLCLPSLWGYFHNRKASRLRDISEPEWGR